MDKKDALSGFGEVDVDWLEDHDAHAFTFNLPGLRAKDVTVQILDDNTLQVSGLHPIRERSFGNWRAKERPTGPFRRIFYLSGF
ncbi:hypothetical protein GOP47_0011651 [Adiantum capillus-veneris]|uniref:SHSP domain-containing protein n=1 Tax=Adiantum capillus-veneris TaxID=13818 RepID=A0A9D4UUK2_ADICA|nr:hypothetical protein GOP47_0011651 [Adiantum capillus-veneris]